MFLSFDFPKEPQNELVDIASSYLYISFSVVLMKTFFFQAFGLMNSDIYHNYLNRSLMMWAGIWVFFMTERIMKMITDYRQVSGSTM
jgi:hypothetical protein